MLVVFIRTIILYILVIIVLRIMGKRQIGQLQPFELVVAIMLSELAAVPMQNTGIPLINGIIPIVTLLLLQITLSYINLKSEKARGIICGKPSIVIQNGKIDENALSRLQYNLNDLLEQLRSKNCARIADVEFAILETNGQLSVIPKSQKRPITPSDLSLETHYEGLPTNLIIDGKLNRDNMSKVKLTEDWLKKELNKFGYKDVKDVLFCSLDSDNSLYFQKKNGEDS